MLFNFSLIPTFLTPPHRHNDKQYNIIFKILTHNITPYHVIVYTNKNIQLFFPLLPPISDTPPKSPPHISPPTSLQITPHTHDGPYQALWWQQAQDLQE